MSHLILNGESAQIDSALHTWQDMLANLESLQLGRDDVIASVHFDGDEVTNFRDDEALGVDLATVGEIRIVAKSRSELTQNTIEEAEKYLQNLQAAAIQVAEAFRCQQLTQANAGLQQLLSGIKMFVALLRGLDLYVSGIASAANESIDEILDPMAATLQEQIKAQGHQDWMLVADILEYELAAQLTAFEEILNSFKSRNGVSGR
jgi:hypothetical protein